MLHIDEIQRQLFIFTFSTPESLESAANPSSLALSSMAESERPKLQLRSLLQDTAIFLSQMPCPAECNLISQKIRKMQSSTFFHSQMFFDYVQKHAVIKLCGEFFLKVEIH